MPLTKMILIIDDDQDIHKLIKTFLKNENYTFLHAYTPSEALEIFRRECLNISLIMLDIVLPEMRGTLLLGGLKKICSKVPVIMMTATPTLEYTLEALNGGASDFITKPISKKVLSNSIEKTLRTTIVKESGMNATVDIEHIIRVQLPCVHDVHWGVSHYLFSVFKGMGFGGDYIGRAVLEAITNAIEHGNCFDPEKKVTIEAIISRDKLTITVTDQGDGFPYQQYLNGTRTSESAKGIFLITTFMDKVFFNRKGNSLTMIKNREANLSSSADQLHASSLHR